MRVLSFWLTAQLLRILCFGFVCPYSNCSAAHRVWRLCDGRYWIRYRRTNFLFFLVFVAFIVSISFAIHFRPISLTMPIFRSLMLPLCLCNNWEVLCYYWNQLLLIFRQTFESNFDLIVIFDKYKFYTLISYHFILIILWDPLIVLKTISCKYILNKNRAVYSF